MKKLAAYRNGNTLTTIYDDGTKTHFAKADNFRFEFPESHDISISQRCDNVVSSAITDVRQMVSTGN